MRTYALSKVRCTFGRATLAYPAALIYLVGILTTNLNIRTSLITPNPGAKADMVIV